VRRWRVVALVSIPHVVEPHWRVAARRWTAWGAARTARRWTRHRRPWGPFVACHGYGYRRSSRPAPGVVELTIDLPLT
jgi:hypothetical protein